MDTPFPKFQFQDEGLIPNISKVNAVLDPELHTVAVYRWYRLPVADLETKTGQVLSPLASLKGGSRLDRLCGQPRIYNRCYGQSALGDPATLTVIRNAAIRLGYSLD